MSETKELIEQLDTKVEALITKMKDLGVSLDQKTEEVNSLQTQLKSKEENVAKLEAENASLKTQSAESAPVTETKDTSEMKEKIAELVKEIDECISLLKV